MVITHGRKRVLEGEEERAQMGSSVSCGAAVPKPCLLRPGRQRNTESFILQVPCFVLAGQDWLGWRTGPGWASLSHLAVEGEESYLFHCVSEAFVKKGWEEALHGRWRWGQATLRPTAVDKPNIEASRELKASLDPRSFLRRA